ncbi:MAG TPA: hypothetical protein VFL80_06515 [Thermoanaerobaculia bacterium]|nr:hypothetical protein [Thermoanaerobaculia bacterium]
MAIVLPFQLTIHEMRVLQEFRRIGAEAMPLSAIQAIKHPAPPPTDPAQSLVAKGYLIPDADQGFSLTAAAKEFLAIDARPEEEPEAEASPEVGD